MHFLSSIRKHALSAEAQPLTCSLAGLRSHTSMGREGRERGFLQHFWGKGKKGREKIFLQTNHWFLLILTLVSGREEEEEEEKEEEEDGFYY